MTRVFVVGGGPSLLKENLELISNEIVVTTNNAFKLFSNPTICHFADWQWWEWNKGTLTLTERKWTTCALYRGNVNHERNRTLWSNEGVNYYHKESNQGLTMQNGIVRGNNAGHQAINISIQELKATEIVLLGFDLKKDNNGNTQWHKEHKRPTSTVCWTETMLPGFNTLAEEAQKLNVKIWNCNFDSAIRCFEFKKLEDICK